MIYILFQSKIEDTASHEEDLVVTAAHGYPARDTPSPMTTAASDPHIWYLRLDSVLGSLLSMINCLYTRNKMFFLRCVSETGSVFMNTSDFLN